MRIAHALALVALVVGCSTSPPPAPPPPPPPPTVGGVGVVAQIEGGFLVVRARGPGRATDRLGVPARLAGLWIDDGDGQPVDIQPSDWTAAGDGRLTASASTGGHLLRLTVTIAEDDAVRVEVVDEIGLPTPVRSLGVTWSFPCGKPDEVDAPLDSPDGRANDDAFRSPVLFARTEGNCAGLLPDLELLNRDRRLPQQLRLETSSDGVDLHHGLDAGKVVELRGDRLHFAHELIVRADAKPFATRAELHDRLWRRHAAGQLRHAAFPLDEQTDDATWDALESAAVAGAGLPTRAGLVRLGERRNLLHDALALALLARRRDDQALYARADAVAGLVLEAPRRSGLLPGAVVLDPAQGHREWLPGDPEGPAPSCYRTVDATATARLLLQLADLLPERRPAIDSLCADLARFLIANQRPDGYIPPLFESGYLSGVNPARDADAELGGATWFLAIWARRSHDDAAREAARRAMNFLGSGPLANGAWPDLGTAGPPDGPIPPRDSLAIARALRAAVALADGDPSDPAAAQAGALADELIALQAVWQPVWRDEPRLGSFAPSNLPGARGDAATPLAAEALLAAHALGGRRELLQRGAVALRRALLDADAPDDTRRTLAVAVAERVRRSLGQAVVDAGAVWGEGLDAVWFDGLAVSGAQIRARLLTRTASLGKVTVHFRNLPPGPAGFVVTGAGPDPIPRADLEAGIELATRQVPRIEFEPPTQLRAGTRWEPSARIEGVWAPGARATLVVAQEDATPGSQPIRIALEARGDQLVPTALLRAEPGATESAADAVNGDAGRATRRWLDTSGLALGERLRAWVEVTDGDWRTRAPAEGPGREITIGNRDVIDVGDQDETPLEVGSWDQSPPELARAPIERFVDGREQARRIAPGKFVAYSLPVRADALAVEIRVRCAGPILVETADRLVLHQDEPGTEFRGDDRTLDLAVADPRRWRDGRIVLRFGPPPGGEPRSLLLARIEWLTTGHSATVAGSEQPLLSGPRLDARINVCVVPVAFPDLQETPAVDALEQAFFGGPEYRRTPAPHAARTVGSAARWITELSGRLTTVHGCVTDRVSTKVTAQDLRSDGVGAWTRLFDDLAPTLASRLSQMPESPRIVFLVHGGRPLKVETPPPSVRTDGRAGALGGVPVVMLGEREADGSYLACGTITLELLRKLYDVPDLGTPDHGSFGELSLSSTSERHLPVLPAGVNLERIGWAGAVAVSREELTTQVLSVPSLRDGHAFVTLEDDTLPDRGRLLIEFRSGGGDAPLAGLSIYRQLPARGVVLLRRADGLRVSPRLWRVSSSAPPVETPFTPGTSADLFQFAPLVGTGWAIAEASHRATVEPPVSWLATPQGETPWSVEQIALREESAPESEALGQPVAEVHVAWRGNDLLASERAEWAVIDRYGRASPLLVDGFRREGDGAVRRESDGRHAFELPAGSGAALRLQLPAGSRDAPTRLFGRLRLDGDGAATLRVFVDGRIVIDVPVQSRAPIGHANEPQDDAFVVDLPLVRQTTWLAIELIALTPNVSGTLTRLVTVPRSESAVRVPLGDLPATNERLADGIARADLRVMRIGTRGSARLRVPIVLPVGHAIVRLHCGLREATSPPIKITATAITLDQEQQRLTVLEPSRIGGESSPMLLAVCQLPERETEQPALLDLEVSGTPGDALYWVDVSVEKQ